jgi:hypothetical protein
LDTVIVEAIADFQGLGVHLGRGVVAVPSELDPPCGRRAGGHHGEPLVTVAVSVGVGVPGQLGAGIVEDPVAVVVQTVAGLGLGGVDGWVEVCAVSLHGDRALGHPLAAAHHGGAVAIAV